MDYNKKVHATIIMFPIYYVKIKWFPFMLLLWVHFNRKVQWFPQGVKATQIYHFIKLSEKTAIH